MGTREDMMSDLTGSESVDTTLETSTTNLPPDGDGDQGTGSGADTTAPEAGAVIENNEPKPDRRAGTKALLDSLSDPDPNAAARGPDGKFLPKPGDQTTGAPNPEAKPEAAQQPKPGTPKTPDQEAEDLIKEMGVKSERGQERIKQVFAKAKEAESKATQLEADVTEFRQMVVSTGMTPDEFAQSLEFGRLVKIGDEKSLRTALEMVEQQRELICKQLGVEAPGVDPLADFPELKKAVENMEVSRAHAIELAKYKRQEQSRQQAQQAQVQSQQSMQEFQQQLDAAQQAANAYFVTRKNEADYPAKIARIQEYFKDPAKINEFVSTYEPRQWFAQIKFMYDNMAIPAAPRAQQSQPARSSQLMQGSRQSNATASTTDKLMGHLDRMGL